MTAVDKVFYDSSGEYRGVWLVLFCVGVVAVAGALLLGSISLVVRQFDHHFSKNYCRSFARQSDYEVRWLDVGFWDYGCYVVTPNGLVPRDDIVYVKQDGERL